MSLQYNIGSMWYGTDLLTPAIVGRADSSLIGNSTSSVVQSTGGTGSVTKTTNVNIVTEITASCTGAVSALPNNDTVLTTQILASSTNERLTIDSRPLLVIPITLNLKEPSIKDVTSTRTIIDSTDVVEKITTGTEVI